MDLIDAEESGALVIDVRSFGPERFRAANCRDSSSVRDYSTSLTTYVADP